MTELKRQNVEVGARVDIFALADTTENFQVNVKIASLEPNPQIVKGYYLYTIVAEHGKKFAVLSNEAVGGFKETNVNIERFKSLCKMSVKKHQEFLDVLDECELPFSKWNSLFDAFHKYQTAENKRVEVALDIK